MPVKKSYLHRPEFMAHKKWPYTLQTIFSIFLSNNATNCTRIISRRLEKHCSETLSGLKYLELN